MNKSVAQQIRRIRQSRDLSQDNMADELGITKGAYSKIERGLTAISVDRLEQIAEVLKVEITFFFTRHNPLMMAEDLKPEYGYATREELSELSDSIRNLRNEVMNLKDELRQHKPVAGKKLKK